MRSRRWILSVTAVGSRLDSWMVKVEIRLVIIALSLSEASSHASVGNGVPNYRIIPSPIQTES